MKTILILITLVAALVLPPDVLARKSDDIILTGVVKDKLTGRQLPRANAVLYNSKGEEVCRVSCNVGYKINGEDASRYSIPVSRSDGTVSIDIECDGYNTYTMVKDLSKIRDRDEVITLPTVLLERAPRKLGEVTVTASKIKFYNRGDTLVYNADAFQLAEGSMLDELVARLPGVELKDGGAIYVNGEYVESLLLNGRNFFKGDNKIMLENIGAYTVKNIEVYRGQTAEEKWADDPTVEKHLTMDVKLKKEYLLGYLGNLQGGYGTAGRYMGRMFTSLFTPTLSLQLVGNINNVSDSRSPGKDDSWTPQSMPTGTLRRKMLGLNYNYKSKDDSKIMEGHASYGEDRPESYNSVYRTNFLAGGDTYEYSFGANQTRNLKFDTRHQAGYFTRKWRFSGVAIARWSRRNTMSSQTSASFREEQDSMSRAAIEAIYSDGSAGRLDAVINRSISRNEGVRTSAEVQGFLGVGYKTPWASQVLSDEVGFKYRTDSDRSFDDYRVNYGSDPADAIVRRNYTKVSPNHTLTLMNNINYTMKLERHTFLRLNYEFRFVDTRRNSSLYALETLADMGVYGTLPAGWAEAFDPSNSYVSTTRENKHTLSPRLSYDLEGDTWGINVLISPEIAITDRRLDYGSDMKDYHVKRRSVVADFRQGNTSVIFSWGADPDRRGRARVSATNQLIYRLGVDSRLPELLHIVDVVNDADPLNINMGNPDLKPAYAVTNTLLWDWSPKRGNMGNELSLSYSSIADNLVRGYAYNTSTGVRINRTYNVGGDCSLNLDNDYRQQFGSKKQFTLALTTSAAIARSADMIGINEETPSRSTVRNRTLGQDIDFSWQIGDQSIAVKGSVIDRHTGSTREDFRDISASHYKYGINGVFKLPGNLTLSTGMTVFTRRGYGVKELDTSNKVWDMRLVLPLSQGKWVIMADAFDLLHDLTNVSYAVNARGRSVVYTNTIPRYMMLSVQYRFNYNPKKINDIGRD
ncbi:MAG: hypothetical protein HDS49_05545 [Bacteroides sp.]|nr:hypothetical protein [Bacteroides sp.]